MVPVSACKGKMIIGMVIVIIIRRRMGNKNSGNLDSNNCNGNRHDGNESNIIVILLIRVIVAALALQNSVVRIPMMY